MNREHKITELKTHSLGNIISLEDYISRISDTILCIIQVRINGIFIFHYLLNLKQALTISNDRILETHKGGMCIQLHDIASKTP